jgi:AcrR family transcriptional regulator
MSNARLARRQAARRRELVETLLPIVEELLEEGTNYRDVSVDQILARTDLSRSTFYRHFADKSDLLIALADPALADVFEAATRPWQLDAGVTREHFDAAMRRNIEIYRPRIALIDALADVGRSDPAVSERFERGFQTVREAVASYIRQGQAEGTIRAELHADETAGWITWMAERGMTKLVARARDAAELERLADSLIAIAWHTVYVGSA